MSTQAMSTVDLINSTPINKIIDLDVVKNQCISNFMMGGNGSAEQALFKYQKNLLFIRQAMLNVKNVDPFSVYACMCTLFAYDYSAAPDDEEIYLVPMGGKLVLSRQAGAHVKRLIKTEQIKRVVRTSLVYKGDNYTVENNIVKEHKENFASDKIIAGYVVFELPNGKEKHVTFRPSQWESWRQKSPQANGSNWKQTVKCTYTNEEITQPGPGFLLNKILAHACKDKGEGWAPGSGVNNVEVYAECINDDAGDGQQFEPTNIAASQVPTEFTPHEDIKPASNFENSTATVPTQKTVTIDHIDPNAAF